MDAELIALCTQEIYIRPKTGNTATGGSSFGALVGPIDAYVSVGRTKSWPKERREVVTGGTVYFNGTEVGSITDGSRVILPDGTERPIVEIYSWIDPEEDLVTTHHWRLTFGGA